MGGNHPNNIDPRPKRRKDKDNPYTIFIVGSDSNKPHYYLSFRDGQGVQICMEIEKNVFDALDRFELDDIVYLNQVDRHYEQSAQTDESLHARATIVQESVDDLVMERLQQEQLRMAIAALPEIQRRRLVLYYFGNFTYEQIADMEGCRHPAIIKSIKAAINNLKKYFSE